MGKRKTIVAVALASLVSLALGAGGGAAVAVMLWRADVGTLEKERGGLASRCDSLAREVQGLEAAVRTRDERHRQAAAETVRLREEAREKQDELARQLADVKVQLHQRATELGRAQDDLTSERQSHADAQARMREAIERLTKELAELKSQSAP